MCVCMGGRMVSVIMITTKISARQQNGENYNNECDIINMFTMIVLIANESSEIIIDYDEYTG